MIRLYVVIDEVLGRIYNTQNSHDIFLNGIYTYYFDKTLGEASTSRP